MKSNKLVASRFEEENGFGFPFCQKLQGKELSGVVGPTQFTLVDIGSKLGLNIEKNKVLLGRMSAQNFVRAGKLIPFNNFSEGKYLHESAK